MYNLITTARTRITFVALGDPFPGPTGRLLADQRRINLSARTCSLDSFIMNTVISLGVKVEPISIMSDSRRRPSSSRITGTPSSSRGQMDGAGGAGLPARDEDLDRGRDAVDPPPPPLWLAEEREDAGLWDPGPLDFRKFNVAGGMDASTTKTPSVVSVDLSLVWSTSFGFSILRTYSRRRSSSSQGFVGSGPPSQRS